MLTLIFVAITSRHNPCLPLSCSPICTVDETIIGISCHLVQHHTYIYKERPKRSQESALKSQFLTLFASLLCDYSGSFIVLVLVVIVAVGVGCGVGGVRNFQRTILDENKVVQGRGYKRESYAICITL